MNLPEYPVKAGDLFMSSFMKEFMVETDMNIHEFMCQAASVSRDSDNSWIEDPANWRLKSIQHAFEIPAFDKLAVYCDRASYDKHGNIASSNAMENMLANLAKDLACLLVVVASYTHESVSLKSKTKAEKTRYEKKEKKVRKALKKVHKLLGNDSLSKEQADHLYKHIELLESN